MNPKFHKLMKRVTDSENSIPDGEAYIIQFHHFISDLGNGTHVMEQWVTQSETDWKEAVAIVVQQRSYTKYTAFKIFKPQIEINVKMK